MKALICSVYSSGGKDPFLSLLPVGVGSLVAVLRAAGIAAKAANFSGISPAGISKILSTERPALLGISVMTHNRHDSVRLAQLAKELDPDCFVVFGGPHATHRHREILAAFPAVDAVVLGEGEETLRELAQIRAGNRQAALSAIRGLAFRKGEGIFLTPPRPSLPDLDHLPPAFTGFEDGINIDLRQQLEFLITSRGCPAACAFCNSPLFWGKALRFRSPRNMVDEIRAIRNRYGLIYFSIRDDTFTTDRKRVIEFCRLLLEERLFILWNCQSRVSAVDDEMLLLMRRAGCDCIQYGIESGAPEILTVLGKRITPEQIVRAAEATRRVGIRLSIYLITGVPGEAEKQLRETLHLLERLQADDGQVSPLAYYPGTRLFDEAIRRRDVPEDLYERSPEEALFVRNDPFVTTATKRLLGKIAAVARKNTATMRSLDSIRQLTGYCHAGNVTAGEFMAAHGDYSGAEKQYREIVTKDQDNPWGWLMLGEHRMGQGQLISALSAFRTLAELVPAHLPAWDSLTELYLASGNPGEARMCRKRSRELRAAGCIPPGCPEKP